MQDNLDTIISLVVVIIGLSMLVQLIVESLKNILKIRWSVYESFLKDTYRNYFYGQANFSIAKNGEGCPNPIVKLLESIRTFFSTVFNGKRIGSTRQRLEGLHDKIISVTEATMELRVRLVKLRDQIDKKRSKKSLQRLDQIIDELEKSLVIIQSTNFDKLFEIYLDNPEEKPNTFKKYKELIDELGKKLQKREELFQPDSKKILNDLINEVESKEKFLISYKTKFVDHIDIWMQDLENRYSRKIAFWSFLIGLIVVFSLNADATTIFRNLRDHPALRKSLIQQSDTLTNQVSNPSIQNEINQLIENGNNFKITLKEKSALEEKECNQFLSEYKLLQDTIVNSANSFNAIYKGVNQSGQVLLKLPHAPPDNETGALKPVTVNAEICAENNSLTKKDIQRIELIIEKSIIELQENYLYLQAEAISGQKEILYSTGLPLGWNRQLLNEAFQNSYNVAKKIFGLLITTILISLGAPFWNDILKTLFGIKSFLRKPNADGKP